MKQNRNGHTFRFVSDFRAGRVPPRPTHLIVSDSGPGAGTPGPVPCARLYYQHLRFCDPARRARDDLGPHQGCPRCGQGARREAWRQAAPTHKNVNPKLGTAVLVQAADDFAACVGPVIAELHAAGLSLRQIVAELDKRGIRTMRGGEWTAATVRNLLCGWQLDTSPDDARGCQVYLTTRSDSALVRGLPWPSPGLPQPWDARDTQKPGAPGTR